MARLRSAITLLARSLSLATLCALVMLPAPVALAARFGTKVTLERGGVRSAAELGAFPDSRVFPRSQEPRAREEGPRNKEGPREKHTNPDSPRRAEGVVRSGGPSISLSNPLSFDGPTLNDAQAFPPDTQGDVGPTQFIVMINGRVRSYDKTSGLPDGALDVDTDVFWSSVMTPPTGNNFTTDPHIRYDRLSGRWIAVMIDVPGKTGSQSNRIMIAVSDGATITSSTNFHFYSIPEGTSGEFADYPTLGIDRNALYIGTNQFAVSGQQAFHNCNVYVVNKASLLAGTPTATRFERVVDNSGTGPFTPQGVDNDESNADTGYFVGVDASQFGKLDILSVANPGATPSLTTRIVTVPSTAFPLAAQTGTGVPTKGGASLDDLDDRLFAAQVHAGHIFTAHNIGVNSAGTATSSPTRDGSRWYEINPASGSVVQSGTVFDSASSSPNSYWIPTVGVSPQGIMAIGGTVAGTAHFADAWYAARAPDEAAGTVGGLTEYTSSSTSYNPPFDRWGDYSLTRFDPQDGMTLWTIQEYVAGTDLWGTKIAKLRAPAPPPPATGTSVNAGVSHADLTISGSSTNGVGYFDPGPTFPNRLQVGLTGCGVKVNGIKSVTPGSVTADVDSTGAARGQACNVTITNPDGQTGSASALVSVTGIPTAAFTASPATATRKQPVTFDGSASHDAEPDSGIAEYDWDFDGNGTTDQVTTTPSVTHAYSAVGTFQPQLVVKDTDEGATSPAASQTVTVTNASPTAKLSFSPARPTAGRRISFSASGSADPDGTLVRYEWDLNGDGVFERSTGTTPTTSQTYRTAGNRNVALRVQDNDGATATVKSIVAVARPLKLTTKFPRKARLTTFLNGRLSGRVSCSRSCTVDISARLPRNVAKKLKAPVVVGRAHIVISGNRARVVRIRVVKKARKVLAQSRGFVVTVSTRARGAVGGVSRKAPTVRITR